MILFFFKVFFLMALSVVAFYFNEGILAAEYEQHGAVPRSVCVGVVTIVWAIYLGLVYLLLF